MTSKEALKDIFMEALLLDKEKRATTNVELFERKEQIEKDLEVLDVIKKFFFIEAYSDKRLNSDFCKITAIEDKEANIDRSALSFIDRDSLKILKEWLENL